MLSSCVSRWQAFCKYVKVNFEEENGVMVFTGICFKVCMAVKVRGQKKVHAWGQRR